MFLTRVRAAIAALAAIVIAGVLAVPAQAAVGDIITVSGTVTSSDGQPLAGVLVHMSTYPGGGFAFATTDESGQYQLEYTMLADFEQGYVLAAAINAQCDPLGALTGTASVTVNCTVPIYETFTVSGVATSDNGATPQWAYVSASDPFGTSFGSGPVAADGAYSLLVTYPRGMDTIFITAPSGDVVATLHDFANGDAITGIDFTYHPAATWDPAPASIAGKVTDKKGKPVADAEVSFGGGPGQPTVATATTAVDGTYVLDFETYWNSEFADGTDGFIMVNGVLVDFVENIAPDSVTTFDYRVGKSPTFVTFSTDLDVRGDGSVMVDLLRKLNSDGTAEWAACSDWVCTGASFGTKHTELFDVTGPDPVVGESYIVLRDTTGGVSSWLRINPDQIYAEAATFGPKKLDGYDYFDFQGDGGSDMVVWSDAGGQTTVWSWNTIGGGASILQSIVVGGTYVSAIHKDLDAAGAEDMVFVTRVGKTYTVTLIPTSNTTPLVVATGRGEPTVAYTDADGDGIFDIVVTYPDHTKHRHHCK